MNLLEVENLTKAYDNRNALRGVTLSMAQGEILALLGPTGAGKTSTLLSIAGLVMPGSGSIRLKGIDVTKADPRTRDVAIVFEGFNLLPTLSVYDNIAFPLKSPIYRQPQDVVVQRVQKAARDLKIEHLLNRMTDQLSGGERQRVAVARALVREPLIYLLDEPLSALDLKLRESLRAELRALQKRNTATILYATHDYHGAAAIADRIALINQGRILQVDVLENLIRDPANAEVGQLIGSPSMALFKAETKQGGTHIPGYEPRLPVLAGDPLRGVTVGYWPEEIDLREESAPGYQRGTVYATDFRGMDRAVQVRFGNSSFRKVVPLQSRLVEGADCFFQLPPDKAFLFDILTGERIRSDLRQDHEA